MTGQNSLPLVTIILPIRDEERYIQATLRSITQQNYPPDKMEIIIVDGMSQDKTREIIARFFNENREFRVKILDNPKQIVPTGLNLAIPQAKGDIIIRVDGHCEIESNYVRNCVLHLQDKEIDGVGGPVETIGENDTAKTIAIAMSTPFGVGGSAFRTNKDRKMWVDSIPFPAYKRETIENAGLFDEELVRNQDDEYNYRIRKMGGKILLSPEIRSKYYSRGSLRKLWEQYFQYGYWKVRVLQKHPKQMRIRQFIPPMFVFTLIGSAIIAPFHSIGGIFLAAIAGVYLLTSLLESIRIASVFGWRHLFLLPAIFGILHLSYGFGFLVGLIMHVNRWGDKTGQVPSWNNVKKPIP